MTRWLHTVRATVLVIALGAGGAILPYGTAATSYGAEMVRGVQGGEGVLAASGVEHLVGVPDGEGVPRAQDVRSTRQAPGSEGTPGGRDARSTPETPGSEAAPGTRDARSTPETPRRGEAPPGEGSPGVLGAQSPQAGHGARFVPRVSSAAPSSSPSATEPSRAGSLAGEGRERPGRREEVGAGDEEAEGVGNEADGELPVDGAASVVPEPSRETAAPVPSAPPLQPAQQSVTHAEQPSEPVLRILPLGSGLVLIGLGLGFAFVGLRVRRG